MKRFLLAAFFIGSFGLFALNERLSTAEADSNVSGPTLGTVPNPTDAANSPPLTRTGDVASTVTPSKTTSSNTTKSASAPSNTNSSSAASSGTAQTTPAPAKKTGQYTDGSYTGSVADAYYGNVQVRVTISGGKITNVTFLQYPNDRSTSRYINEQATPYLASEAIDAQGTNISGVSGASDTSIAFVESLSSALAKAKS